MFEILELAMYGVLFVVVYFEVFLLVTALETLNRREERKEVLPKQMPSVTVVVPCYNEEKTLGKTVRSLLALNYPKSKLDILIVNDGSSDNTKSIAERFAKHSNVRTLTKENGGKHTALNLGIQVSDSEFIGCLDADSYVHPDALKEIILRFDSERVMAVTPAIKVYDPKNILQYIQRAEYILGIFFRKIFANLGAQFITPGPFSIYRRFVFESIGPFRPAHNTEDLEMGLRMQKHGMFIDNAPNAEVYTSVPNTIPKLITQRVRWAYGFINNAFSYRGLFFNPGYASLGFVILPTVIASILGGLLVVLLLFFHTLSFVYNQTLNILAIKAFPVLSFPSFDIISFTSPLIFVVASLSLCTLALFAFGSYIGRERRFYVRDIALYLLFYGYLAPVWLTKAVFDSTVTRRNNWR